MIKADISKNVINTQLKSVNIPLLWRKFILNITNNRGYVYNFCNGPLNNFDRHCREW